MTGSSFFRYCIRIRILQKMLQKMFSELDKVLNPQTTMSEEKNASAARGPTAVSVCIYNFQTVLAIGRDL